MDYEFNPGQNPIACITKSGEIFCAFNNPYLIHSYQFGTLKKTVNKKDLNFDKPTYMVPPGLTMKIPVFRSRIKKIICLNDDKYFVLWEDNGPDYVKHIKDTPLMGEWKYQSLYYIDLFDKDGKFLKSFEYDWEKYGTPIHIDNDGFIYTNSKDDIPKLIKNLFTFE